MRWTIGRAEGKVLFHPEGADGPFVMTPDQACLRAWHLRARGGLPPRPCVPSFGLPGAGPVTLSEAFDLSAELFAAGCALDADAAEPDTLLEEGDADEPTLTALIAT
jgi:hypothetical protein